MLAMNIFIPYALMPYYGAMPGFAKLIKALSVMERSMTNNVGEKTR